jgi:hypothetical protein
LISNIVVKFLKKGKIKFSAQSIPHIGRASVWILAIYIRRALPPKNNLGKKKNNGIKGEFSGRERKPMMCGALGTHLRAKGDMCGEGNKGRYRGGKAAFVNYICSGRGEE